MLRALLRYGPPIVLAIAPLLTYQYSLLDFFGYVPDPTGTLYLGVIPYWPMSGPKPAVEMRLRILLTLAGIGLLIVSGYVDAYLPSRTLESFRHDYLDQLNRAEWRKAGRVGHDIRINVMYLRWRLHRPFGRTFQIVWRDGFEPSDRDGQLRLCIWQGVCGMAAWNRKAAFVDFRATPMNQATLQQRWLLGNNFRLFRWQLALTRDLKAILSIPLFERRGNKGRERIVCVGVINLDTQTERGAEDLAKRTKQLSDYFAKHGTLIAKMR